MRMIDLYYVRPWRTGKEPTMNLEDWWTEVWQPFRKVPMSKNQIQRYELEQQQSRLRRELEQQRSSGPVGPANRNNGDTKAESNELLNHASKNNDQESAPTASSSRSSSSSSTKGKPAKQSYMPLTDPNPQHWSVYLPRWLFYAVLMDIIPFGVSFLTFEQIESFSLIPRLLFNTAVGSMVIFDISLANYTIMIIWATVTGDLIRDTEWTMVRHYFPGFATSSAEFWRQWHHLFKYIWVDLGFKPVHHILSKYVTPKVSNRKLAKAAEMVLPVMGVFLMSGLMHEYMMVAMWHGRPGYMTAFFLLQGAGTIVSKALNNTVGQKITVPPMILIALTWAFNLSTASLFMEPVFKNQGYNMIANQSILIRVYNLLRSYGVF
ncbi:hypothetical protein BGZ54_005904 [Gamsiella multidivaricata]|nr:hypothetical protein BGZ54_005904 [Gamsiella multidivaricata]